MRVAKFQEIPPGFVQIAHCTENRGERRVISSAATCGFLTNYKLGSAKSSPVFVSPAEVEQKRKELGLAAIEKTSQWPGLVEMENSRKRPSKKRAPVDGTELVGLLRELLAQVATISAQLERRAR